MVKRKATLLQDTKAGCLIFHFPEYDIMAPFIPSWPAYDFASALGLFGFNLWHWSRQLCLRLRL